MSQYKIEAGTGQHIGDRQEQQDRVALLTAPKAPGYVMAVLADGMGGLAGGALAADQVVRTAQQNFERFSPQSDDVAAMLKTIAEEAHTIIKLSGLSSEKQPHSTIVVLVLTPDRIAIWAHAGDSRLYRFSGPNFSERTMDHSLVEKMVAEGKLSRQEAKNHRMLNLLVNSLGTKNSQMYVTVNQYDGLKIGDAFLLCTDGLWPYFTDSELGAAIAMNTPRDASEMLIKKTRERAASMQADNCTFAIIKLVSPQKEVKDYKIEKMRRAI